MLLNSCTDESPLFIKKETFDADLDRIFQSGEITEKEYLTYLFMGPKWLFVNADSTGIHLAQLRETGYNPDSIWIENNKCKNEICAQLENLSVIDSFVEFSFRIFNNSPKSIVINDFEIADVLGSEIANIWYYNLDSYLVPIISFNSVILIKDRIPIENNIFGSKHINAKFQDHREIYKHIDHVVWNFNYSVIE